MSDVASQAILIIEEDFELYLHYGQCDFQQQMLLQQEQVDQLAGLLLCEQGRLFLHINSVVILATERAC